MTISGCAPIGPTWELGNYFLGADNQGRDVMARLLYGGRNSLLIAGAATLLTLVIAIEKLLPLGQRVSAGIGVGLIVLGVAVASGSALMLWLAAGDGGPG